MKRLLHRVFIITLLVTGSLLISCSHTERCRSSKSPHEIGTSSGVAYKMWSPEYYTYRNGRYVFTKGHYSKIHSKKMYLKRSVRGYTTRKERMPSNPNTRKERMPSNP